MAYSKGDLVAAIAEGAGLTKKAAGDALEAMLGAVTGEHRRETEHAAARLLSVQNKVAPTRY